MFHVPAPNYTNAPNALFDEWLPRLKLVELRVLMVVIRKTFGWHKIRDRISLTQLEKFTGSQRGDIIKAAKALEELGLLRKDVTGRNGDQESYYELVVHEDSNKNYQCESHTPPSVNLTPTKETLTKETKKKIIKEKVSRSARKPIATPIILNPETEKFQGIEEKDIKEWQETFPAVNIRKELAECLLWAKNNYRQNYRNSLNTWMRNKNVSHTTPFNPQDVQKAPHTEADLEINKNRSLSWEKEFSGKGSGIYSIQAEPSKVTFILPNNEGFSVEYTHEKHEFLKLCQKATNRMRLSNDQ
jgi:hypothetical protein